MASQADTNDPDDAIFTAIEQALASRGPDAALDQLCERFRAEGEYHKLFDTLNLKARRDVGLPLIATGVATDLPDAKRAAYEDQIIAACRLVGRLLLERGDLPAAFHYFSMIGELEPIKEAIDRLPLDADSIDDTILEIALSQGAHPEKGLAMLLARYGLCQAITACEGILSQNIRPEVRDGCVKTLVRALHAELVIRLTAEIAEREGAAPTGASLPALLEGRDWLFAEENYHIDTSHLNAVARLARVLPPCPEGMLAIELCEYGRRLSPRYHYSEPAPFENVFVDTAVFLRAIQNGDDAEAIKHFRQKADNANADETGPFPLEVLVNLLVKAKRWEEAIDVASRAIDASRGQRVSCPSPLEICQLAGRFGDLSRLARQRNDAVSFIAGLIQKN